MNVFRFFVPNSQTDTCTLKFLLSIAVLELDVFVPHVTNIRICFAAMKLVYVDTIQAMPRSNRDADGRAYSVCCWMCINLTSIPVFCCVPPG